MAEQMFTLRLDSDKDALIARKAFAAADIDFTRLYGPAAERLDSGGLYHAEFWRVRTSGSQATLEQTLRRAGAEFLVLGTEPPQSFQETITPFDN